MFFCLRKNSCWVFQTPLFHTISCPRIPSHIEKPKNTNRKVLPAEPIVAKLVIPNKGAYDKNIITKKNRRNFIPNLYCLFENKKTQVPIQADHDHFLIKLLFDLD